MIEEKDLSLKGSVDNDDKIRVVTEAGLSQSIEVGKLKTSFIDELSDRVDTLEDNDTANNTAHDNMDSRLTLLETAVGDKGNEENGGTIPASGLVKKVSDIESNLAKIDPGEIKRLGVAIDGEDGVDGIRQRLTAIDGTNGRLDQIDSVDGRLDKIDGTNGRLDKIDGTNGRLAQIDGQLDDLEDSVGSLASTKLDKLEFQNAVAAGFKVIRKTPTSASATGQQGEVCWDTKYFYVCVGDNTWKRTPLESWESES